MYSVICSSVGGAKRYGLKGNEILLVDITGEEKEIWGLTDMLNRNKASEMHIRDVIEDWFGVV